jgi:futalosine hydrolase
MHILVVAATEEEIKGVRTIAEKKMIDHLKIDFLITGVGMTSTAYALTKRIASRKYQLAVNIGLAGTFRKEIKMGDAVTVVSDTFADVGAEDGDNFLSAFEMGLQNVDHYPFVNGKLKCDSHEIFTGLKSLKKVKAITVNTIHGNDLSIQKAMKKFHPDIESMEGAAFFYVCMMEKIPCIQLRAISNRVERRDRSGWDIELSLKNLELTTINFLKTLQSN